MTHRERLNKDLIRISTKIQQWLDKYFPEYIEVFKTLSAKASLAMLKKAPLPSKYELLKKQLEELEKVI